MTFGSLFAGIGGFDLGFERSGMECMWQVEIDPVCRSVLARHFMDMGLQRGVDVRDVKTADFVRPDVICGGFPCQDISVAGKRAGLAGERSGLWFEFRRIIAEFAPRWVCIENVAGLLSSNEGRDLGTILGQLGELGYGWAYRVFDSQYHGVAQRRRRVFIVGYLGAGSAGLPARVLFEPESVFWDSPPCRETGTRTSEGVAGCLNSGGNNGGFRTEPGEHLVVFGGHNTGGPIDLSTACNAHGGRQDFESETFIVYQCHGSKVGPMGTLRVGNGSESGGVPFVEIADTLTSSWHRSNGAKAGNNSGIINPIRCGKAVRRLTPRECERLQSFPESVHEIEIETCFDHQKSDVLVGIRSRKWQSSAWNAAESGLLLPADGAVSQSRINHRSRGKHAPADVHIYYGEEGVEIADESARQFPASCAEKLESFHQHTEIGGFAQLLARINTTVEAITSTGKVESHRRELPSTRPLNGRECVVRYGSETMPHVKDALIASGMTGDRLMRFTTSPRSPSSECDSSFQILFSFVIRAIAGFIPRKTSLECSLTFHIVINGGWTRWGHDGKEISNSARYRMLGNAVTVNVAEWIGRRIMEAEVA